MIRETSSKSKHLILERHYQENEEADHRPGAMFSKHLNDKTLVTRILKELLHLNNKNKIEWDQRFEQILQINTCKDKHVKNKKVAHYVIRDMETKITMGYQGISIEWLE